MQKMQTQPIVWSLLLALLCQIYFAAALPQARAFVPTKHRIVMPRLRGGLSVNAGSDEPPAYEAQEEDLGLEKKELEQIPIKWVIVGTIGGLCLLSCHIARLLVLGYGVCYPAYCSLKTLEAESAPKKDKDANGSAMAAQRLLAYWICFGILLMVESATRPLTADLHYYEAMKLGFILWLQHGGALSLQAKWLRPLLAQYQEPLEETARSAVEWTRRYNSAKKMLRR